MPDKEGSDDEKKSTKSVVNKKQKQMLNQEEYATEMVKKIVKKISARAVYPTVAQNKVRGEILKGDDLKIDNKNPVKKQKKNLDEEGYDVARDEGRVRPSKDKKDATTLPVSDEVKKTRKVNKGPSAFERVKKKYKGQIMDVKKEELDLTKVAEAFGGYIVESEIDPKTGRISASPGEVEAEKKILKKYQKKEVKRITSPKPGDIEAEKKILDAQSDPNLKKLDKINKAQDKLLDKINTVTPAQKAKTFKQSFGTPTGADPKTGKPTYMRSGVLTKSGKPKKSPKYRGKLTPDERVAKVKAKIDRENPTYIGKSGKPLPVPREEPGTKGFKGFKKRTQRSIVKTGKQVAKVAAPVTTPVAKFAKASPLGATIAGIEVAKITPGIKRFFAVKPPLPPAPKGGKVGRRTAG